MTPENRHERKATCRREFITLLGGAASWPVTAHAQQRGLPVIGLLSSRSAATDTNLIAVFRQALNEGGFVEGQNVVIDYRWADGQYDRLPALATSLVRRQVAVIVTIGGEVSGLAAKAATATIPIVFVAGTDPVAIGLVTSLNRPGGNITGHSVMFSEQTAKRLGLLQELVPKASLIGVLVNPSYSGFDLQLQQLQEAAGALRQELHVESAHTEREIGAAFEAIIQRRARAILVANDPFFFNRATQFVVLAARHAIPTLYFRREFAAAGGLMSYGSDGTEGYRALGVYAARILKGEKPGDLPVQLSTKFELVINLMTAKTLGIDVPTTLLARADEVIE
jgi:putative tryptophan/tyrosine transport system substrate-binding protein